MQLHEFPQAIAEQEQRLLEQKQVVLSLKDQVDYYDYQFDYAIAFDIDLKNDLQRRAKRAELLQEETYRALLLKLRAATEAAAAIEIRLQLTQNQFAVAKLEARERIAKIEAQA